MFDPATTGTAAASDTAAADAPVRVSVIDGHVHLVEFVQSKVLDEANITGIGAKVDELIDASEKPRLLLDFEAVEHLSSAALGMLINANNRIREKNGQLRLCNIRRQIMEVFTITKLDTLFKIFPDRPSARESFDKHRSA
ncbi:MAG: STAS domain-containing protein [Planctomycetota bacterium]